MDQVEEGADDEKPTMSIKVAAEFRAELKGEIPKESVGRALDAILDAASPVTKYLGLVGDRIQLQREEVLLEVARRAKARIEVEGGTANTLSPKALTALLEHASKEAPEDERLIDMWANLLGTAATQHVEMVSQYVTILSHSTAIQAAILDSILSVRTGKFSVDEYLDVYDSIGPAGIEYAVASLPKTTSSEDFASEIFHCLSFPGVAIDCINVSSGDHGDLESISERDGAYSDEKMFEFENLCRLGVLDRVIIKMKRFGKYTVDILYYVATPVGADLFACCNPDKAERGIYQRPAAIQP